LCICRYTIPVDNFGSPDLAGGEAKASQTQKQNRNTEQQHGTETDTKGCTRCFPSSMFGTEGHFEPPGDDDIPYDLGGRLIIYSDTDMTDMGLPSYNLISFYSVLREKTSNTLTLFLCTDKIR